MVLYPSVSSQSKTVSPYPPHQSKTIDTNNPPPLVHQASTSSATPSPSPPLPSLPSSATTSATTTPRSRKPLSLAKQNAHSRPPSKHSPPALPLHPPPLPHPQHHPPPPVQARKPQ